MDAFSYLSVLLSVVLGLAIQQILQGYRALALNRRSVRLYWPTMAWSVILLLITAQHWWASFGLVTHQQWSFAAFSAILVQTALIYMFAGLVLPDIPAGQAVDLRDHYFRERVAFFIVGALAITGSALREVVLDGNLPQGANLAFHLLFLAMSLTAVAFSNERLHKFFAAAMLTLFVAYVTLLFAQLGTA
jgi:hypothetical protein